MASFIKYIAFQDFYFYKRDIGVNINDFLVRYEFLYQKLQKFGMTLLVLNAANLSEENGIAARNACACPNDTKMKEASKNVFSDISSLEDKKYSYYERSGNDKF